MARTSRLSVAASSGLTRNVPGLAAPFQTASEPAEIAGLLNWGSGYFALVLYKLPILKEE